MHTVIHTYNTPCSARPCRTSLSHAYMYTMPPQTVCHATLTSGQISDTTAPGDQFRSVSEIAVTADVSVVAVSGALSFSPSRGRASRMQSFSNPCLQAAPLLAAPAWAAKVTGSEAASALPESVHPLSRNRSEGASPAMHRSRTWCMCMHVHVAESTSQVMCGNYVGWRDAALCMDGDVAYMG